MSVTKIMSQHEGKLYLTLDNSDTMIFVAIRRYFDIIKLKPEKVFL